MSDETEQSGSLFDFAAEAINVQIENMQSEPVEWEVVFEGGLVNVREHNSSTADILRTIQTGTVVLGVEQGAWLKLSGMPGYMQIQIGSSGYIEGDRKELLRKRQVTYSLVNRSCELEDKYEILDPTICKHAANWTGQTEAALSFEAGCLVDLVHTVHTSAVASEDPAPAPSADASEHFAPAPAEEEDEVASSSAASTPAPTALTAAARRQAGSPRTGRRLRRGAQASDEVLDRRRRLGSNATSGGGGGGGGGQRICSTAPYQADKLMPVRTETSVTTATVTTTKTTMSTATVEEWGNPSLFCFAVFRAYTAEQDLVKEACRLDAGIFACDTTVTVSGEKIWVGKDKKNKDIWSWVNAVDEVAMGDIANNPGETTNSWLNTQIFINAIKMLVENDLMWKHDWIVKGDPDAVLFPDRIRTHLINSGRTGTAAFFENCFHDGEWWLYGSLELFSKQAMERYRDNGEQECEYGIDWKGWGEDMYMDVCMKKLGADAITSGSLVGDQYCMARDCHDGEAAAFHPYKTKDDWRWCLEASTGMSFPAGD